MPLATLGLVLIVIVKKNEIVFVYAIAQKIFRLGISSATVAHFQPFPDLMCEKFRIRVLIVGNRRLVAVGFYAGGKP